MSDAEVPQADALEQSEPVEPDAIGGPGGAPADPEAPEADALEQSTPVAGGPGAPSPTVGIEVAEADAIEVAEADAIEQASELGADDEHDQ